MPPRRPSFPQVASVPPFLPCTHLLLFCSSVTLRLFSSSLTCLAPLKSPISHPSRWTCVCSNGQDDWLRALYSTRLAPHQQGSGRAAVERFQQPELRCLLGPQTVESLLGVKGGSQPQPQGANDSLDHSRSSNYSASASASASAPAGAAGAGAGGGGRGHERLAQGCGAQRECAGCPG